MTILLVRQPRSIEREAPDALQACGDECDAALPAGTACRAFARQVPPARDHGLVIPSATRRYRPGAPVACDRCNPPALTVRPWK